jgi:hypothetical protein
VPAIQYVRAGKPVSGVPGPLRRHAENPRYFADASDPRGGAVVLAGSHHWDSVVVNGERPQGFDFAAYLDRIVALGHNFVRLWTQEAWLYDLDPGIYERTGPGAALDGEPRYDLERVNPVYLDRLAARVRAAGARGCFASVMLFQGWSLHDNGAGNPWFRHPFHRANNRNGIDGDPARAGHGRLVHTLEIPSITGLQERYVSAVVQAVGAYPNVLFEVSNESPGESFAWQCHLVGFLRESLAERGWERPLGITCLFPRGRNRDLFRAPADWVSPGPRGGYREAPPPARGDQVVVLDTDHLWGIGGDAAWVWRAFLAGYHPIYMDPLDEDAVRQDARRALGGVVRLSRQIPLARMAPTRLPGVAACALLARERDAEELVAIAPRGESLRLDLRDWAGDFDSRWLPLVGGEATAAEVVRAGRRVALSPPSAAAAILWLKRRGR